MKLIHCLFAIYLLVLSCLPCADMGVSSALHSSKETTSISDKHSHEDTNDLCSPFCVCSCCGSQISVDYMHYNFTSFKNIISIKIPEYQSQFTSTYSGSIWQPPQINS